MLSKKELDELRPWVSDLVRTVLGFSESTVVSAALDCVGKSLSRQATTEHLMPFLDNATPKFVETVYRKVLEVKAAKLANSSFSANSVASKKRSVQDVFGEHDDEVTKPTPKKKRISRFAAAAEGEDEDLPPATSEPPSGHIQEMLASTMRQIEERKRQTEVMISQGTLASQPGLLPTPSYPSVVDTPEYQHNVMSEAIEKARKAAELQARIQSQLLNKPGLLSGLKPGEKPQLPSKPTPLILDEEGRTVDSAGRTIQLTLRTPTLKANIRAQQRASFRQITQGVGPREESEETGSFFDLRVGGPPLQRARKQFRFNEPGKFIKQGQMLRAKAQLDQLQSSIASVARKTGISSATKLALIAPSSEGKEEDIPLVEWWDAAILPSRSYTDYRRNVEVDLKYKNVTNLVEHPVPFEPPSEPRTHPAIPVMLTKQERKKLRKQRRREIEKEKQEKIQFGLVEKPEPKVRISNLMRVLGSEAIQDPTKVEAHVRAQMAERQRKHELANAARKLTPEQRKAKKLKKIKEDVSCGIHVVVFRVRDLRNPAIKFKVDMNAQQFHLTGCVMLYQDVNLVVVEGGPKGLKKFKRLMMHRIKWNPKKKKKRRVDDDSDSDSEAPKRKRNTCSVVWEGMNQTRCFHDWRIKLFPTEALAREYLKHYGVEHYWDLALSQSIVEGEEED